MKQYIDKLLHESPTQVISSVYAIVAALGTFLLTLKTSIDGGSGWAQAALIAVAALIPLLQGSTTKTEVFSGSEMEQISNDAHATGRIAGRKETLAYVAEQRKQSAAKGVETRARRTAKPAKATKTTKRGGR